MVCAALACTRGLKLCFVRALFLSNCDEFLGVVIKRLLLYRFVSWILFYVRY